MKKAVLITHGPLNVIGGVERSHRYFLQFLKEEGFSVDVYEPSMQPMPSWMPGFSYPFRQYFFSGLSEKKLQTEYDLIITTGYTGGYLRGHKVLNFCFGSVKSCTKAIDAPQTDWKLTLMNRVAVFFDALTRKGKACVAISDQVAGELQRDYGASCVVVQCAIDTEHFSPRLTPHALRQKWGIRTDMPVGVYVGRWAWNQKGLDILVEIMKQRSDIQWVIAPDAKISLEGIRHLVIHPGASYDDLPEIYSLADFSIQLSRYESFGYSFVESLACGTPSIATQTGVVLPAYQKTELEALSIPLFHHQPQEMMDLVNLKIDRFKDSAFTEKLSGLSRQIALREYSLQVWNPKMRAVLKNMGVLP